MAQSLEEYVNKLVWERRKRPPSIEWWNSLPEYKQCRLLDYYYPQIAEIVCTDGSFEYELHENDCTKFEAIHNWHSIIYNIYLKSHQ